MRVTRTGEEHEYRDVNVVRDEHGKVEIVTATGDETLGVFGEVDIVIEGNEAPVEPNELTDEDLMLRVHWARPDKYPDPNESE